MLSVVLFPTLTGTFTAVLSLVTRITQCSVCASSLCTADLGNTVTDPETLREVKTAFTFIPSGRKGASARTQSVVPSGA